MTIPENHPARGLKRPTLQDVLGGLNGNPALSESRRRDLKSAVNCFATLTDSTPALIPLDLAEIRAVLDLMVPIQAKMSRKRWANLRSDLSAAIAESGMLPMVKTAAVQLSESWLTLFQKAGTSRSRNGLSRLAHWASERQISPRDVNKAVVDQFITELLERSLVRKIIVLRQDSVRSWNVLCKLLPEEGLEPIAVTKIQHRPARFPWNDLPESLRQDVEAYVKWGSVPDPLDETARSKALAPRTLDLRQDHIHSAVTAAAAAGLQSSELVNLGSLTKLETFKTILRHRWEGEGRKLTAYTHGVAGSLIAIAKEWVRVPDEELLALKAARRRLGSMKFGMTEKNKTTLMKFNDKRVRRRMLNLPDQLWQERKRELKASRRGFIDLQTALGIEILLFVAPLRMENLSMLQFGKHIQWPHSYDRPAWLIVADEETKTIVPLEYELPAALSKRLMTFRDTIAPAITGMRPSHLFVTWDGKPRSQAAIALAIHKTVLKYVGVRFTPHQFRHLAAKLRLDYDPDAIGLIQELLAHKNHETTRNFYAGISTLRAGRAHSEFISNLKKEL